MIPKVIHYCWFGGNPLPESAKKCIASWEKFFPDYEIREWNESNFDINCCAYVKEAYKEKKWAFVSDYARFWILYNEGGIYFDTDVEVIREFDDIVERGPFMGCEVSLDGSIGIAPGLGLGVEANMSLFKEILDYYHTLHFIKENGELNTTITVVDNTTTVLVKHDWKPREMIQTVSGVTIYPPEYFCPMDYVTGKIKITENTYSIHHYMASWHNKTDEKIIKISRFFVKCFGLKYGRKVARFFDFPLRVMNKINALGFIGMLSFVFSKCFKHKG